MKLEYLSGLEIGKLVNTKQVSPVEVINYFLNRINTRNPSLNAFVYTRPEEALRAAKALENKVMSSDYVPLPFAGAPTGLKDFLSSKKGWTNTCGGVKSLHRTDKYDSVFCNAVEKLGAIVIGKTNAPSFGFSGTCDNKLYGPTRNPLNHEYNSGGSSGGSAAAVSDGLVPFAEGGDAGGSIRIPSAWCGCFGFKPSVGTVPNVNRPDAWAATHPFCMGGPISRTVADGALILDSMTKYDPRDPFSIQLYKPDGYIQLMDKSIKHMKIALTEDFDLYESVHPDILSSLYDMAVKLKHEAGSEVDRVKFEFKHTLDEFIAGWCLNISLDTSLELDEYQKSGLDLWDNYDELPAEFLRWNRRAREYDIHDMLDFNLLRTDILDAFESIFEQYDVIISPVTTCMPVSNTSNGDTRGPKGSCNGNQTIGYGETFLVNFVGYPAASVPIGYAADGPHKGMPIGMQIIGKKYHDEEVLAVARTIEKIQPWLNN